MEAFSEKQYSKDRYKQSNKRMQARKARQQGKAGKGSQDAGAPAAPAHEPLPELPRSESDFSSDAGSPRGANFETALDQAQRLLGTRPMRHAALLEALKPEKEQAAEDPDGNGKLVWLPGLLYAR